MQAAADFVRRRKKLLKRIIHDGLDVLLVTDPHNVTYLTGFTGDSSYLWLARDKQILLSDSRYATQISEECPDLDNFIRTAKLTKTESVAKIAKSAKARSVGIESASVTKSLFDELNSCVASELVDTEGWVENQRAIKDDAEIATIRRSIQINQRAFEVIRAQLAGDQTEKTIAHNLEHQIRAFGGSRCAFDPIVGVGPRGALPHGVPSNRRIDASPFVLIDWGTQFSGYASDLTRVLVTARIPRKLRKIYDIVLKAQLAAIAKIRPGASFQAVDKAARQVIEAAGYGKNFGHGLGHGFGLQIHEQPYISPIHQGTFKPNMVVTVEPGIYLKGWGGIRIEDDIRVTRDGHEVMSSLPKLIDQCVVEL